MKLKNLILTGLLATAAYKLYQNRELLAQQALEAKTVISESQQTLTSAQEQLQNLKTQAADLKKTQNKLAYSFRIFQEEAQPHLNAIKQTLEHSQKKTYLF